MRVAAHAVKASQVAALAVGIAGAAVGPAAAQWLSLPLPGTPRTADGKPNLSAPTPKTLDGKPDLSGIWRTYGGRYPANLAGEGTDVPMHPWAAAVYKERLDTLGRDKPQVRCMPHGVPDAMLVAGLPFKIIQTPGVTVVLYEEFHKYRQIFTDGRALPVDPDPAWYGYSVGRWEGDTFVVESAGFKEGAGSTTAVTWFYIDVKDDDGKVTNWGLEMGSTSQLLRAGWKRDSMKIGDVVTVEGSRGRDWKPDRKRDRRHFERHRPAAVCSVQSRTITTTLAKIAAHPQSRYLQNREARLAGEARPSRGGTDLVDEPSPIPRAGSTQ